MQAVIDAARETVIPHEFDPEKPTYVIVPAGSEIREVDMSKWRDYPSRATGIYKPATVDAFTDYVNGFFSDATTVWVHPSSGKIVAILDDSFAEAPGWRQHQAILELSRTPEWLHWLGKDGTLMSQVEFAEHIEVGLNDITDPPAADVLELAQSFHAKTDSVFRQATRLDTGETQFQYDEEIAATAGRTGQLSIPSSIALGIAPFVGEERYALTARFRYRLQAGKLSLGYKIDRPDLVTRDSLQRIEERLRESFSKTFSGEPAY